VILADTSIWVDHLRSGNADLAARLRANAIVCHPMVVAEIALGSLKARTRVLGLLDGLATLPVAEPDEIRRMIEIRSIHGRGIGYVDAALLASCLLVPGTRLWTRDRRLGVVAGELHLGLPVS
jgi:predicted nucleic acid-binding protein